MEKLLINLVMAILSGGLVYTDTMLEGIVGISLYADRYMNTLLGTNGLTDCFNIFLSFGISLIVLKFLKKGFEQYILWTEGDADADPLLLLTGFFRALAIAVSFPTLYSWLGSVIEDMSNKVVDSISNGMKADYAAVVTSLNGAGLFTVIVALIFFICLFLLYIQFLMRGMEILILRIGMPIACVGLMDTDKGVFKTYIQKFFQSTLAVLVQIALAELGVALFLNSHIFWGIAALRLAIKTPKFLQEFIIISGGQASGVMSKAYQATRMVQTVRGAFT